MSSTLATRKTTLEKSINFQKIQKLKIQNVSMFKKCNFFPNKYKNFPKLQVFFSRIFFAPFILSHIYLLFVIKVPRLGGWNLQMTRCTTWQYAGARLINAVYGQFWQCGNPNARILEVIAILPSFISNTKCSEIPSQSHLVHLNSFEHLSLYNIQCIYRSI